MVRRAARTGGRHVADAGIARTATERRRRSIGWAKRNPGPGRVRPAGSARPIPRVAGDCRRRPTAAGPGACWRTRRDHASQLLGRLAASGHVVRLARGRYALPTLAPFALPRALSSPSPSYVSFHSALYHHGLIEQVPFVIYAATLAPTRRVETPLGVVSFHQLSPGFFGGLRVRRPVHRRRRHTGEGTGRLPLPRAHEEQTLSGVARARAPAELSAKGSPTLRSEHRIIRAKDVRVRSARAHYGALTRGHRWARTALAELSGLGCGGVSPGDPAEEFPALPLSLGCVHGEVRALEQRRRRLSILWIPGAPRQRRASRYPEGRRGATKSAIVKPTPAPAPAEQRAGD